MNQGIFNNIKKIGNLYLKTYSILYLIAGLLIVDHFRYNLEPDAISYISIAQKYLNGDFYNAINGYWGPLFSWLLIPALSLGGDPFLSAKFMNFFFGFLGVLIVHKLSCSVSLCPSTKQIVTFCSCSMMLAFSLLNATPDILLTLLILAYLSIILKTNYIKNSYQGMICGFYGALSYLAKSYAFPFFAVHFLLINFFYFLGRNSNKEKYRVCLNFFTGSLIFITISGIWIAIITYKYDHLMVSSSGGYNLSLINHRLDKYPDKNPMHYAGLFKPPNQTALSIWEDPYFLKMPSWNPLESKESLIHYAKVLIKNFYKTYELFQGFSFLSISILLILILFFLHVKWMLVIQNEICLLFFTLLLFSVGYIFVSVVVVARYLWVSCFLLLIMGGYIIDYLFKKSDFFTRRRKIFLYSTFIVSFVWSPLLGIVYNWNSGCSIYEMSQKLKKYIKPGENIASDSEWHKSLYLTYYLNGRYFGIPSKNTDNSNSDLRRQLEYHEIDYYLVWNEEEENTLSQIGYNKIGSEESIVPKLYSRFNINCD